MFQNFDNYLNMQDINRILPVCIILTLAVGTLDYLTGYEISFFIFYAVPIWLATWYIGKKTGLAIATFCFLIWFGADLLTGHTYSHPLIPYWNGIIRLTFFIFTAFALSDMKARLHLEATQADYDSLTGILNGRGFRERAATLYELLKREQQRFALAFIDVDNFKQVNDTMGHAEGDQILKKVAQTVTSHLRNSDLFARLGGDEFVIFMPGTDTLQGEKVVSNLKKQLDEMAGTASWPIGFSIGLGGFDSVITDVESAIQSADTLMYSVKKHGKGRVVAQDMTTTQ